MRYISDDLDDKIKSLKGRFSYLDLLKETKDLLFGYSKEDGLNFVRQSIYRLKKEGIIGTVKRELFEINTGYIEKEKTKISSLIENNEASRDTDELAFTEGVTTQIINRKTHIISNKYRNNFNNDVGGIVKFTRHNLNKDILRDFEMARLSLFFDLNNKGDVNTFARVLIKNDYMNSFKVRVLAKYLHPRYKKQIENLAKKIEVFQQEGHEQWT